MKKKFENIPYLMIVFFIIIFSNSCFKDNGIPKANLEFLEFRKHDSKENFINTYKIKFLSDVAINDKVFKKADAPHLTCLLTKTKDFTIKDIDNAKIKILGYFDGQNVGSEIEPNEKSEVLYENKKNEYEIDIIFYDNKGSNIIDSPENDLKKLLLDKSCIPCKLEQRFYLNTNKPYLSHPMCIPTEDILKALND